MPILLAPACKTAAETLPVALPPNFDLVAVPSSLMMTSSTSICLVASKPITLGPMVLITLSTALLTPRPFHFLPPS